MFQKILGLVSDSATYGASSLVGQLVAFVLLRLYTEYLGTADYGVLGMLSIVVLLFGPIANLGMTNAIFRRYSLSKSESDRNVVLSTGLTSITACSLALLAASAIAAQPIADHLVGDPGTVNLVRLSLLAAAVAAVGNVPRVTMRAARRVRTVALLNLAQVVFTTLPTIWFVVFQQLGVLGVVLGNLTGEAVSATIAFCLTYQSFRTRFDRPTWREMLSYGLPFVPHQVQAVALALFGQYMVREMLGLGEAGLYTVAMKFAMPVMLVVTAVQNSWVAYKFQIHAEDDDPQSFFRSTLTYYVAGITYLWVGVSVWGPEMVRLMTTPGFHEAAYLVWAVSLVPVTQGLYFMSGTGIELSNNTRPYPVVSLAGLLVVVAAAFWLVPTAGAMGAALATVLGWLTMACLMYHFAQRRMAIAYDWPTVVCFIVLAAVSVVGGSMAQELPVVPRVGCAVLVSLAYPLAAFVLLLRSREERHRMHILLGKFGLASVVK